MIKRVLIFLFLSNVFYVNAQHLSISSGSSTDFYFPNKQNIKYHQKAEGYGWIFGGARIAYHHLIPNERKDQVTLFVNAFPLYTGFNPVKNNLEEYFPFSKSWSNSGDAEPAIGLSYDFALLRHNKGMLYAGAGLGARFSFFGINITGYQYSILNNGNSFRIDYTYTEKNKTAVFSPLDLRYVHAINEGFFLFLQSTYNISWNKWIEYDIYYEHYDAAANTTKTLNNKMYNNSSLLIQFGLTFNLKKKQD